MRRLLSPIALALALACLWLPFLTGSPRPMPANPFARTAPSVTYTGLDLAFGGTAEVLIPKGEGGGDSPEYYEPTPVSDEQMYGHPQPTLARSVYGIVAVVLICIGIVSSLIPAGRIRNIVPAATALLGSLAMLAMAIDQRREVAELLVPLLSFPWTTWQLVDFVALRYGFWIAMMLLVTVGFAHVAAAVPGRVERAAANTET